MSIGQKIKKHWLLIAGVLIIGVYGLSPQFLFERQLGEQYEGIYLADASDELYYNNRVRELYDGQSNLGSPYLWENKSAPQLQPSGGETIMFALGRILGLDNITLSLWGNKLIFPALLFIALYLFFYSLTRRQALAFLFGLTVMLASNLVFYPQELLQLLGFGEFQNTNRLYLRPITPAISSLFFFLYATSLYWVLGHVKQSIPTIKMKLLWLVPAVFFGLSFYIYPYTWSFILVLNGILALLFALRIFWPKTKDQELPEAQPESTSDVGTNFDPQINKIRIISLIAVTFGGLLISIPYWLDVVEILKSPELEFAFDVYGLTSTHDLVFSKVLIAGILFLGVAFLANRSIFKQLSSFFVLAMIVTGFVAINQQVVTGKELYSGHYHWYYNVPTFFLSGFYMLSVLRKKIGIIWFRLITTAVFVLVIVNSFLILQNIQKYIFPDYAARQQYSEVFNWINNNTEPESVILTTDLQLSNHIPMYTSANVYTSIHSAWYLVSPERLQFNYFVYLRLIGVLPGSESFLSYFEDSEQRRELFFLSGIELNQHIDNPEQKITQALLQEILADYQRFFSIDFAEQMKRYRADYVIVPTDQQDNIDYNFIELINESDNYVFYRINSS